MLAYNIFYSINSLIQDPHCSSIRVEASCDVRCFSAKSRYQKLFCFDHREIMANSSRCTIYNYNLFCLERRGDLVDVVVPFMGESISDGTLSTFLKKPGDRVEIDEPIAQVETDKMTIQLYSNFSCSKDVSRWFKTDD